MIVFFRHGALHKPVLKLAQDKPSQVLLTFIPFRGEHITLHLQPDGTILRTHFAADDAGQLSTWDAMRVSVARKLGYRDPERHSRYYIHAPLQVVQNMNGYHLAGRRIDLRAVPEKDKYLRKAHVSFDAPSAEFMLGLYLSRPECTHTPESAPHLTTALGDVYFEFGELDWR